MLKTLTRISATLAFGAAFVLVPATQAHAVVDTEVSLSFPTVTTTDEPETCVTAVNDNATTSIDTPVTIDVLGNDSDDCEVIESVHADALPLFVDDFAQGSHGSVVADGDSLKYTPNSGFSGVDTFTYTACVVQFEQCDTATVTVTIPTPSTTQASVLGTTIVNATTDPTVLAAGLARTGSNSNSQGQIGFVLVLAGSTLVGFAAFRRRQQIIGRYARR